MEFNEKIVFLLNITATNNVELAEALNVKPSIISLYKTGKRGIPKKETTLKRFSDFFSDKLVNEYQFKALAEVTDQTHIPGSISNEELSELILAWFQDKSFHYVEPSAKLIHSFEYGDSYISEAFSLSPKKYGFERFTGRNAKINASRKFLQHLLTVDNPGTLYIQTDNKSDWFFNDRTLPFEFINVIKILVDKGARVKLFLPPPTCDYLLDMFSKCLPLIFTERVEMYYYPRFKDNSFRNMIAVLENEISMFSFSVYDGMSPGFITVSDDPSEVNTMKDILNDYLTLCNPAIIFNRNRNSIQEMLERVLAIPTPVIALHSRLSPFLTPPEAIDVLEKRLSEVGKSHNMRELMVKQPSNSHHPITEICKVATAKQVKTGDIKIFCPALSDEEEPAYTPKLYAEHLKNILKHMEEDDQYLFIPIPMNDLNGSIIIRKGSHAVLLHKKIDPSLFEIVEPDIVRVLEEYLYQRIDRYGESKDIRINSIRFLKKLIRELEE